MKILLTQVLLVGDDRLEKASGSVQVGNFSAHLSRSWVFLQRR